MREHLNSFFKLEFDKIKKHIQHYALSDLGREHLDQLVPSSDPGFIRQELLLVSEMKSLLEKDDYPPFENIIDIRASIQHASIENYILSSDDLHKIALVLATGAKVDTYFTRRKEHYPALIQVANKIHIEKIIQYNIRRSINEDGKVRDDASKELLSVRRLILDRRDSLRKTLESILKNVADKEWAQEEIITTREGRMVIPVKVEHKNRISGFIHSSSASGQTVYVEPTETLEVNNEIRTLEFQEQREIERILRELTQQVREAHDNILTTLRVLGQLDFIHARAKYSLEVIGVEPLIKISGALKLFNAYHPILLQRHKREHVVPLNLEIGDSTLTLIITGPNAGGKSVAMKTAGLLILLSQAGCHIPASPETEMRVFSDIFVDMGDEQSIENDLSSFSSHLTNLKTILEHANKNSLVLIDEIGSGTDPNEGASLATSILEELTAKGSSTIVTTHHGSLKTFAFEHPQIENGAMEFDQKTLQPTYRFRAGIPGSSYAIEMAERMDMPASVITRSKELKGTQASKLEDLILDLEQKSQALRSELDTVSNERCTLNHSIKIYEEKIKSLEKEVKQIKTQALHEAKTIVDRANAAIERAIRDIKERSADRQVIKTARDEIQKLRQDFQEMHEEVGSPEPNLPTKIDIGSLVRLRQTDSQGEIIERIDADNYLVIVGSMKVKVNRKDIIGIHQEKERTTIPVIAKSSLSEVQQEVDLRGMYGDEAVDVVEKMIDQALVHGLQRIDIIHGKGTGALRKRITEYLKNNPSIKSFRLGEWNEGGSGVTVVELT